MSNYYYEKNYYNDVKYYTRDYDLSTKIPSKKQKKCMEKVRKCYNENKKGYKKMARQWYNRLLEKRKRKRSVWLKFIPEDIGRKNKKIKQYKRVLKTRQTRYVWRRQTKKKNALMNTERIVPTMNKE